MRAATVTTAPHYINWNYTYACNFACTHCYSRAPKFPRELPTDQFLKIADQIIESGVFAVGFGGGEPLLRSDLKEVLMRLGLSGVQTHVTTNGWLVDEDWVECFTSSSLDMLVVSVDSARESHHDEFRAMPGSFDRACQAARRGVAADLNVFLSVVLNATNLHELPEIVALGESLGVAGINFKVFRPAGNGLVNKDKYLPSPEKLNDAIAHVRSLQARSSMSLFVYQEVGESSCGCGITELTLRPNGDVTICPYSENTIGSLTHTPLSELWLKNPNLISRRSGEPCCLGAEDSTWPLNPYLPESNKENLVLISRRKHVPTSQERSMPADSSPK